MATVIRLCSVPNKYIYIIYTRTQFIVHWICISSTCERSLFSYAECSNTPLPSSGQLNFWMHDCITSEQQGFEAQPIYSLEKYPMYNKQVTTFVIQYGNDISPSQLYFTRLWLVKILMCVLEISPQIGCLLVQYVLYII